MKPIRVILADDHRILRDGLKSLLEQSGQVEVIAEAQDGCQAAQFADELLPEVVVMDIAMPVLNGIDATRLIRQRHPEIKVVVLTMYETDEYIAEILKAGASCYVTKDTAGDMLLEAIQMASIGSAFLQPSVAKRVVDQFASQETKTKVETDLTPREMEVLRYLAQGLSNKALASQLKLSLHTVRAHRSSIMHKLEVHNTAELVNQAMKLGLI